MQKLPFQEAFEVLKDRDAHFDKINEEKYPPNLMVAQVVFISLFVFGYGLIMGSYNSFAQSLASGAKLWLLIFLTLLICFPSFYIVQLVLGSKVGVRQLSAILLSGFLLTATLMLAFAPIALFFQLSGDNYNFLQLLHVFVFVFSGFFGMRAVLDALKNSFAEKGVYPKLGLVVFRIWVVIFAFVGLQLSWNLRPFVGYKEMPFQLFRHETQGNVYTTLLRAVGNMMGVTRADKDDSEKPENADEAVPPADTTEATIPAEPDPDSTRNQKFFKNEQ
jgi:hypothetical protein